MSARSTISRLSLRCSSASATGQGTASQSSAAWSSSRSGLLSAVAMGVGAMLMVLKVAAWSVMASILEHLEHSELAEV